ncbi:MAG TPA: hypothetical protein VLM38_06860 [Blastocatellia bacterium]|nr:hypothetical protein [Blastocatellia bacterium]
MNSRANQSPSIRRRLKRIVAAPLVLLAAIIILFEDWLWDDLARFAAAIGRLPIFRQIETFIAGLPPYAALAFFLVPSTLLIPVKLMALYFVAHGHAMAGLLTVAVAKVAGTALLARLFTLTRPKLLSIAWFAWLYQRFIAFKARIYAAIKATRIYRAAHQTHLRVRRALKAWLAARKGFLRRRWNAALRFSRNQGPAK